MPVFAANLSMMFTELPFRDRFSAAADQGFQWVEYLFPYDYEAEELAHLLEKNNLRQALFNLPPGDWAAGERGLACLPGREKDFDTSVETAIRYARALGCPRLHVMAGNRADTVPRATAQTLYLKNIRRAAQRCSEEGLEICLEPINHYSMPQYFLRYQEQAAEYMAVLAMPNVRLQFDFFHCQMEQGNVAGRLQKFFPLIGHCQLAGVPERHEPDQGELYYPYLLALLDQLGYRGVVGCEYMPAAGTAEGLSWIRPYGVRPRVQ